MSFKKWIAGLVALPVLSVGLAAVGDGPATAVVAVDKSLVACAQGSVSVKVAYGRRIYRIAPNHCVSTGIRARAQFHATVCHNTSPGARCQALTHFALTGPVPQIVAEGRYGKFQWKGHNVRAIG
ncbi:hypothetical protein AB0P21_40980 [Kribbella sp. NPDC056861]|uniref:hypothetical protein n=1 Tax=Kribbella sp. NPDC056861 TaxID=3154857 RepID=UPI0034475709